MGQGVSAGVTVEQYARYVGLPDDFLRDAAQLRDGTYYGRPAVVIPYFDEDGKATHERLRLSLDKGKGIKRFHTQAGDSPGLYGLWRLHEARNQGYVYLVEGESDCHALWFHGLPAVGVPGARNWNPKRDEPHFAGIERIYPFIEPDQGGESLLKRLTT
jgi:hypothetical protein